MPRIAYLAPDLSDPAVARRVRTLRRGGAAVTVLGFRRTEPRRTHVADAPAVDLGRTQDARLLARMASVCLALVRSPAWGPRLAGHDVLIARNLEMLLLARVARWVWSRKAKLVYEVLDIHRLMCGSSFASRSLRRVEGWLMKRADLLVVSSPAFVAHYFDPLQPWPKPWLLLENKILPQDEGSVERPAVVRPAAPPWRIGWFGMIRCQRSLDLLCALARSTPGFVQVDIRGRPSLGEFARFHEQIAETPGVEFHGPYGPEDLEAHYADVHFAWAIDFFEAGLNSSWLLPNRLYEGQFYGAIPIALRGVATGDWLARHNAGALLGDVETDLHSMFASLSPDLYADLAKRTQAIPLADLVLEQGECAKIVRASAV